MTDPDRDHPPERKVIFRLEDFAPHVGTQFSLLLDDGSRWPVELMSTKDLDTPSRPKNARRPFALIFRGPANLQLAQRIYGLEHPEMSGLELFLVPLGPDELGQRFEAVFN